MKNSLISFATLLCLFSLISCATVPISGRKQASLSSEKNLSKMAAAEYRRFISQSSLCTDSDKLELVHRVSHNLIEAARRYYDQNGLTKQFNRFKWEVNVVENSDANAFCMPGGKIAVFTGILGITQNEDQLAAVLGHEIAHALARHSQEKKSHGLMAEIGSIGVQVATANTSLETRQTAGIGYNLGAAFGFMLPYSRKLEKEADQIGMRLMIMAGYDPIEAPLLWQQMADRFGDAKTAFFNTHPTYRTRRQELQAQIPEAIAFAAPYREKPAENPVSKPVFASSLPAAAPVETTIAEPVQTIALNLQAEKGSIAVKNGTRYVVQVETVSAFESDKPAYTELNKIAAIRPEAAVIDHQMFDRVLLGNYASLDKARTALELVKKQGFSDAFLVEYVDGQRGKWIR